MIKHQTNSQLAATLKNVRAFEERAGAALYQVARNAGSTMTNFSNDNERHPAVIRWLQAVGRGSTVRLEAQTRLHRASVVAIEDHAVIEALTRLPSVPVENTVIRHVPRDESEYSALLKLKSAGRLQTNANVRKWGFR